MDHAQVARTVLDAVGGKDNIAAAAHCATRLRLVLRDSDKINQKALDAEMDIKGTFAAGGMFQVIIGPGDVNTVYDELLKLGVQEASKEELKDVAAGKQNWFSRFIKVIADIFVPMLPALIAGGLTMSLNNVLTAEGLFGSESVVQMWPWLADYAAMLQVISSSVFAMLPVLVGFSAVKRFGGNPYLGAALGAAMVSSDLTNAYAVVEATEAGTLEAWSVFGLQVTQIGYQGQVIPIIAVAWVLASIEKWLHKKLSGTTDFLVTPLLTMIVTGFLAFVVIGPIMRLVSDGITDGILWIFNNGFIFGGLIFGLLYSPIVITGLHQSFPAIELPLIADIAVTGGSFVFPIAAVANVGQAAATFAVFLRTRDPRFKGLSGASSVSALFGITEPAIFGVNLRLKWPLFCGMIGGAAGGVVVSLLDLRSQALGSAGILAPLSMIPTDIPGILLATGVSFAVSLVTTLIYASTRGKADMMAMNEEDPLDGAIPDVTEGEPAEQEPSSSESVEGSGGTATATKTKAPTLASGQLALVPSPLEGTVVPLADVPDPGFASGAVGKGLAIDPTDGVVRAPDDCTVIMSFPTGHAVGVRLGSGVEILIHIGIDTVQMEGEGFTVHVAKGDTVRQGDPLITFDREAIKAAGYTTVTPVVVANHRKFGDITPTATGTVSPGDDIIQVTGK